MTRPRRSPLTNYYGVGGVPGAGQGCTPITIAADREAAKARALEARHERRRAAIKASIVRAGKDALRAVPTATITARGRLLSQLLSPYIGVTPDIQRVCSLIARIASRHCRLAERECSYEMTEHEAESVQAESDRLEARARALVASLPARVDGGAPLTVTFQGDPRGFTLKVHVPDRPHDGNTWGLGGDFGV